MLGIAHAERLAVGDDDAGMAPLCSRAAVSLALSGGCWRVRKVTCPKSRYAQFQLSAQDMRAVPGCPPDLPLLRPHRLFVALASNRFLRRKFYLGSFAELGKGDDVEAEVKLAIGGAGVTGPDRSRPPSGIE